ncbi:hypothetical protein D910_07144 [Dendroctonus ponderosae]|uniref:Uncharacterized protein n=1 Tax=Dendroctonus ponderosae TaxID=77166 RepID=U4UBS4_DENPD|nr:hypothetical protein D910_07144 [Dendroctonus ponderosae]
MQQQAEKLNSTFM